MCTQWRVRSRGGLQIVPIYRLLAIQRKPPGKNKSQKVPRGFWSLPFQIRFCYFFSAPRSPATHNSAIYANRTLQLISIDTGEILSYSRSEVFFELQQARRRWQFSLGTVHRISRKFCTFPSALEDLTSPVLPCFFEA